MKKVTKITNEEIEKKAAELSVKVGRKVNPLLFETDNGEQIIGYIQEPDRITKMRAIDMLMQSPTNACDIILQTSLLKDESDPRILSDNPANDKIYLGALMETMGTITFLQNQLKKK